MNSKEKNLPVQFLENGTADSTSRSKGNGVHLRFQVSIRLQYVRQGYYPSTFRVLGKRLQVCFVSDISRSAEPDGHGIVAIRTFPGDLVR